MTWGFFSDTKGINFKCDQNRTKQYEAAESGGDGLVTATPCHLYRLELPTFPVYVL